MRTRDYGIDLYWLPLGAGGRSVRLNGRVYEGMLAAFERRTPLDLYHSALELRLPTGRYVVEVAPAVDGDGDTRGVVAEGPVGSAVLGGFRLFRYEVRRWLDGTIPDVGEAVDSPQRVTSDLVLSQRVFDSVPCVPTAVWGRDELGAGDMWNSNSVTSWLLASAECELARVFLPAHGRAPGWHAGVAAATRGVRAERLTRAA